MAHSETSTPQHATGEASGVAPDSGAAHGPLAGDASDADVLVQAEALSRSFGDAQAVRGLSFSLRRGEVVALCGPNGAGKSTTLKLLAGVLRPSRGRALIGGLEVGRDPRVKRLMGYLPEQAPAYADMTPPAFLRYIASLRGLAGANLQRACDQAIDRCGLTSAVRQPAGELSRGFRRRLSLAQALVHSPQVLILDEPTAGLDPLQAEDMRALIGEVGRDKVVLMSTHTLAGVEASCSRILVLCEGTLVADDAPGSLVEGASTAQVEVVLRPRGSREVQVEPLTRLFSHLPGVLSVDCYRGGADGQVAFCLHTAAAHDVRPALFEAAVANHLQVVNLHRASQSLATSYQALVAAVHDGPPEPAADSETHPPAARGSA